MRYIFKKFCSCFCKEKIVPYKTEPDFISALTEGLTDEKEITNRLNSILERAYDIRKVELELYWKRATYFWGFLIAAFTAYFVAAYKLSERHYFFVSCIGFLFSLSWYLVNRGSTYWLTHWERIIDVIETKFGTNFYKFNLTPPKNARDLGSYYPFSVSRINIKISFCICVAWLGLMSNALYKNIYKYHESVKKLNSPYSFYDIDYGILIPFLLTIVATFWLLCSISGTSSEYSFYKRTSTYKS